MTTGTWLRLGCAGMALVTLASLLSGCGRASDPSAVKADSTQSAVAARNLKQAELESERLRRELDRLKTQRPTQGATSTKSATPRASRTTTVPSPPAGDPAALRVSFDRLAAQLSGSEGVAFTSVGGTAITQFGSWRTGVGWSTVKVPLAVAAVAKAKGRPDAGLRALMRRAITASDNAAAEQLWSSLGPPQTAASQVQAELRSAGDGQTRVQSQRVRAGFTAFGQTTWSLANQAKFAAALPCIRYSNDVIALMGAVESGQRWGIGAAGRPAQFKGGWGPGTGGGYLVRQMGIVTLANGSRIGLAVASEPADGSFGTGTANVTALARWAVANIRPAVPGGC
jgi:hypothetical protein